MSSSLLLSGPARAADLSTDHASHFRIRENARAGVGEQRAPTARCACVLDRTRCAHRLAPEACEPARDRARAAVRARRRCCGISGLPLRAQYVGCWHSSAMLTADCVPLAVTPTLFAKEFSLADRVALVSGGNRGIGLEMAMALAEAGARAVYCVDLPKQPGEEWGKVKSYLARMEGKAGEGRLEYISADVRDQVRMSGASWGA